jgi:hypothetical protein
VRSVGMLAGVTFAIVALPAMAVQTSLTSPAVSAALDAGRNMANQHGGYTIAPYLLFSVPDAVLILDDNATVEAVQLGTPFERLRFEAYREQMMRTPFNADDVATFDEQHANRIDFIVYAHSRTADDRAFLGRFGGGTLTQADGTTIATAQISRSVAVIDTYTKPGGVVVNRFLGQVTYRFVLTGATAAPAILAAPLTFVFTDDGGGEHRLPVALADFP